MDESQKDTDAGFLAWVLAHPEDGILEELISLAYAA